MVGRRCSTAAEGSTTIYGTWPHIRRRPGLTFTGRIAFTEVDDLYQRSVATVLLLPDRYAHAAQMTQRLPEAVLAGCVPIAPATIRDASRFVPADLIANDGDQVAELVGHLAALAGTARHADLLADCVARLGPFRLSRQLDVIEHALTRFTQKGRR